MRVNLGGSVFGYEWHLSRSADNPMRLMFEWWDASPVLQVGRWCFIVSPPLPRPTLEDDLG